MTSGLFNRTPMLSGMDPENKRQEILDYFQKTFDRYESLFETLATDEAFLTPSIPLRHPLIFYYGHTATFFINKLLLAGLIDERVNPEYESTFAIGVDEMSWDDLNNTHYDWPTVFAVHKYRQRVRAVVERLISSLPLELPIEWESPCGSS